MIVPLSLLLVGYIPPFFVCLLVDDPKQEKDGTRVTLLVKETDLLTWRPTTPIYILCSYIYKNKKKEKKEPQKIEKAESMNKEQGIVESGPEAGKGFYDPF